MSLEDARVDALLALLIEKCTVAITGADGAPGTGFLIDEDLVLTSAHVAEGERGDELLVEYGQSRSEGESGTDAAGLPRSTATIQDIDHTADLALLTLSGFDPPVEMVAVTLQSFDRDNGDYYGVGFALNEATRTVGLQSVRYTVNATREPDRVTPRNLIIQSGGALVEPGMSGGPLFNPENGTVVGVLRWTNEVGHDFGGGAVPINRAAALFSDVAKRLVRPPAAARPWRDALGADAWASLRYDWEWDARLDISISGTVEEWTICLDPEGPPTYILTSRGLPSQVARALFRWAQRRRVREREDVDLLGDLLGSALLPEPQNERVRRAAASDDLAVRLHFAQNAGDAAAELFDIPWEFARIKHKGGTKQLAAEESIRLSRVIHRVDPTGGVSLTPRRAPLGAVGIVVQPDYWQDLTTRGAHLDVQSWPRLEEISQPLEQAMADGGRIGRATVLANREREDVDDAVAALKADNVSIDVMHYVGYGQMREGKAEIAFWEDHGVLWEGLDTLFDKAGRAGARLLVIQFLAPAVETDIIPIPPHIFLSPDVGAVPALVFTGLPVRPLEAEKFNVRFYKALGDGDNVERAIQRARTGLRKYQPVKDDCATFAWFTLMTGEISGIRLLDRPAPKPDSESNAPPPDSTGGILR